MTELAEKNKKTKVKKEKTKKEKIKKVKKEKKSLKPVAIVGRVLLILALCSAVIFVDYMLYNNLYIYYYNKGNEFYEKEDYQNAIIYYEKALKFKVPEGEECDIRVNLVLAKMGTTMVYHMDELVNMKAKEAQECVEEIVKNARDGIDILVADGCASKKKGEKGHDREAQTLTDELLKLIAATTSGSSDEPDDQGGSGGDPQQPNDPDDGGEDPIDKLKEIDIESNKTYWKKTNTPDDPTPWYDYFGDSW